MGHNLAYAALLLSKAIKTSDTGPQVSAAFVKFALMRGFLIIRMVLAQTREVSVRGHQLKNPSGWHKNLHLCGPASSHCTHICLSPAPVLFLLPFPPLPPPLWLSLLNTPWERLKRSPFPSNFKLGFLKATLSFSPENEQDGASCRNPARP